jgi:hypothetical protein
MPPTSPACTRSWRRRAQGPRHRQDREAAGRRQPRGDHRRVRRHHGRPRRPRVELPLEAVPVVQKRAVEMCRRMAKPVIVATQMLESMTHARCPRAPRHPTSPTPSSTAPTRSCSPARRASATTRSSRCRRWPASSSRPRSTASSGSVRSAPSRARRAAS